MTDFSYIAMVQQRNQLLQALKDLVFYTDFANFCATTLSDADFDQKASNARKQAQQTLKSITE